MEQIRALTLNTAKSQSITYMLWNHRQNCLAQTLSLSFLICTLEMIFIYLIEL